MSVRQYQAPAQDGLLQWVRIFETDRRIDSLQDLRDGVALGQIVYQLFKRADPEFNMSGFVQDPVSDIERKQNLEWIQNRLVRFLSKHDLLHLRPSNSEFRAMIGDIMEMDDKEAARRNDGICELVSVLLETAANHRPLAEFWVPKSMEKMDKVALQEIRKIVERPSRNNMEEDSEVALDPDLMAEELQLRRVEVENLKRQNADLQTRVENLRLKHQELVADLEAAQDELEKHQRSTGADVVITDLKNQITNNLVLVDQYQSDLQTVTSRAERLEKENEVLRAKAKSLQEIEDKARELQVELEASKRTIKSLENYKKKAQDLTTIQQRNRVLEAQIVQVEQDLRTFEELKASNRGLQKEIDEKSRALAGSEESIMLIQQGRDRLQDANEELRRKIEFLEQNRQIDEATIKELRDQLQFGGAAASSPPSPGSNQGLNLEQELSETDVSARLEIARLKAENNLLRNNMSVAGENERLRHELESANKKVDHYRLRCTEAMEQHAVAQEQVNALIANSTGEGDAAFVNMRRELFNATHELEKVRERVETLTRDVAERDRELLQLKTDLKAIGEDQTTALASLKASDELISDSLRAELDSARKQLGDKMFEFDQLKEQLIEALISREKMQRKLEASAENQQPSEEAALPAKGKKEDAEKVEKLKSALRQKIEQLEKAEQEKYDLQRRLRAAESGSAQAAQKAANEQMIKNLQRENAMITTAWYDLTSRLQSNHVVLQRRNDAPRSWLNKQRQMVNATPRR